MAVSVTDCPEQLSLTVRYIVLFVLAITEMELVVAPLLHRYAYGGTPPERVGTIDKDAPGHKTLVSGIVSISGATS
jgi:hypothetical protein